MPFKRYFNNIGPGPLIAAAFIGPGTVTLCVLAGVEFGYSLLWALVFAVLSALVLQDMSVRMGLIARRSLVEIIRMEIRYPLLRRLLILLILTSIVVGNAAYEAGNIGGGVLGLEAVAGKCILYVGDSPLNMYCIFSGSIVFVLLITGSYKIIEKILIVMVVVMSLSFVVTACIAKPNPIDVLKGAFGGTMPSGSLLTVVGLIGTTVVPYNLFLHTALVKEKWKSGDDLPLARQDTVIALGIGGLVSMSIVIVAAAAPVSMVNSAADLTNTLAPVFGTLAKYFLGIGLFSAGITSAITAPLAVSYVACSCFGWKEDLKSLRFKAIWVFVLIVGVTFSTLQVRPITMIKFAQVTNGLLLPVVAGLLFWAVNKRQLLGKYSNSFKQNLVTLIILVITISLGMKTIFSAL